jgi:UDP-N-acetylmuramyl-tripeptide synthetase
VGSSPENDLVAGSSDITLDGITTAVTTPDGPIEVHSKLVGRYNLENILCAAGTALALGVSTEMIQAGIEGFDAVPGRMEPVPDSEGRYIFVDYAHTPDALDSVLQTLAAIATGRLVCVFGCGGDRDRTKRPLMGAIAGKIADLTIITSDNPRTEDPDGIIKEILAGVTPLGLHRYGTDTLDIEERGFMAVADRSEAIRIGIRLTGREDTLLIAGKGHETYQIIGQEKLPFDDRQEARQALGGDHA